MLLAAQLNCNSNSTSSIPDGLDLFSSVILPTELKSIISQNSFHNLVKYYKLDFQETEKPETQEVLGGLNFYQELLCSKP